jgi:hypothetical protein
VKFFEEIIQIVLLNQKFYLLIPKLMSEKLPRYTAKPELVAPGGSYTKAIVAALNGAEAVYL